MRLSTNTKDKGYDPSSTYRKVYLDGKELDNCCTADEEEGMAIVYVEDENGDYEFDQFELKTRIVYGKVEIR